jgi:hypothetical protein
MTMPVLKRLNECMALIADERRHKNELLLVIIMKCGKR